MNCNRPEHRLIVNAVQHSCLTFTACWYMIPVDAASYLRILLSSSSTMGDYVKRNEKDEAFSTQRGDKYEIIF